MNAVVRRKKERKTGILPGPMTALVLCMHGLLLMQAGLYPLSASSESSSGHCSRASIYSYVQHIRRDHVVVIRMCSSAVVYRSGRATSGDKPICISRTQAALLLQQVSLRVVSSSCTQAAHLYSCKWRHLYSCKWRHSSSCPGCGSW
jgi:hypothetical protein